MSRQRTLLVVAGGTEAVAGIERAREMGLHVVVSDGSADAPGLAAADDTLIASTYDVEATVAAATRYHETVRPIDGVICIASDVPLTVAAVADALGLPGVPVATALLATDKLAMKDRLAADAIALPWYAPLDGVAALRALMDSEGPALVIKPVDSRGARGVIKLDAGSDLDWAYAEAHAHSPTGRVMAERYLAGPQISTESIVVDGVAHTIGLADRNYEQLDRFAPFMIEDGGELPSRLPAGDQAEICALVQRATQSLGVRDGVVKGDIVLHEGSPTVIEVALRLSGGYLCTYEIPLSTGVDFVGHAIRVALGEAPTAKELTARRAVGVAQRWLFPEPGRVSSIEGVAEVSARPEVALCEVRVSVGSIVGPVHSHPARAGVVIATGSTRQAAVRAAQDAIASIEIVTEPAVAASAGP